MDTYYSDKKNEERYYITDGVSLLKPLKKYHLDPFWSFEGICVIFIPSFRKKWQI